MVWMAAEENCRFAVLPKESGRVHSCETAIGLSGLSRVYRVQLSVQFEGGSEGFKDPREFGACLFVGFGSLHDELE